jgi:hypothetical protein
MRKLIERILRNNLFYTKNVNDMIELSSVEISDMIELMINQLYDIKNNKNEL